MIDALCGPCHAAGRLVKAHYQTNPPTCRDCYAKRALPGTAVAAQAAPAEPENVEGRPENEVTKVANTDWAVDAQKDRDAGMSVADLAKKYNVTTASIYGRTMKPPKQEKTKKGKRGAHRALSATVANSLLEKWHREANEAFAALPLDKKAQLLSQLEEA